MKKHMFILWLNITDYDDDSPSERAQRMITPEVRGILKSGSTVVPSKPKTLTKGESSEVSKLHFTISISVTSLFER